MQKKTGKLVQHEETITVCDKCESVLNDLNYIHYNSKWSDGYDWYGGEWDFCSLDCLVSYIEHEIEGGGEGVFLPGGEDVLLRVNSAAMKIILEKIAGHEIKEEAEEAK